MSIDFTKSEVQSFWDFYAEKSFTHSNGESSVVKCTLLSANVIQGYFDDYIKPGCYLTWDSFSLEKEDSFLQGEYYLSLTVFADNPRRDYLTFLFSKDSCISIQQDFSLGRGAKEQTKQRISLYCEYFGVDNRDYKLADMLDVLLTNVVCCAVEQPLGTLCSAPSEASGDLVGFSWDL